MIDVLKKYRNYFFKYRILFFIIFLFSFAIFLRFFNLSNVYIFGFDEEYQATYAMTLVNDLHPIWIGVSASFLDFYLGPYFTYFTAFLLWISKGDPLFTGYVAGVVGAITLITVFFVGWRFFNLTTGMISSLLYMGLPLIVFFDQKYWNPMFVQLIVLLMFTSLMLIKKSPWWWLLYSAMAGAILETDIAPLPLILIGIWFFIKGKYWLNKKLILSCIAVFLLFYWPLLVFDYYHNWSNLTVLSRYDKQAKQAGAKFNPSEKLASIFDTMGRFWYLEKGGSNAEELNIFCNTQRTHPSIWLSGLSVILLLVYLITSIKSKNRAYLLLSYFLLVSLTFYILYSGGSFEYYLHGFMTAFIFIPGILISKIKRGYKLIPLLLIVLVLGIGVDTILNVSDKYSIGSKKRLIEKVMKIVGDNSFSIDKSGVCYTYEGWRYLFKAYGRTPTKSFTDKNFAWLYPEEVKDDPIVYEVFLSEYGVQPDKDMSGYNKINEKGFSAYIKKLN